MEIGVYGLGRFGSFFASRLSGRCTVKAWSRDPNRPAPPGVERVGEEELLALPAVFLCVAISALPEVLERIAPRLAPGTLVMDTCSVKSLPAAWMQSLLPPTVDILASHPLFGPDSAAGGMDGLPMVLWPVRLAPAAFDQAESASRTACSSPPLPPAAKAVPTNANGSMATQTIRMSFVFIRPSSPESHFPSRFFPTTNGHQ